MTWDKVSKDTEYQDPRQSTNIPHQERQVGSPVHKQIQQDPPMNKTHLQKQAAKQDEQPTSKS